MGELTFLNGLFLAGAATALVPIIIHLVQRRRIQQVVFSSVRFLRKMSQRVVRRRRLRELLLILLRAVALAALAVAFARPFFSGSTESVAGQTILGDEAVMILVDNSYSMSVDGRLEAAKAEARSLLESLDPAAKVGVASFSSQFQLLCPIGSGLADARRAVEEIKQSWRGTDLGLVLEQTDRVLSERSEEHRRVILISDFQRSSWRNRGEWKLAAGTVLSVRDVAEKDLPNVLVARVAVPRLVVAGGSAEIISAKIVNLTDQPLKNAEVTFKVDGKVVERRSINLRPRSAMPARFRYAFGEPGDTAGSVSIAAKDDLPTDDTAYFCVHVTPRVRVLLVNGDRAREYARDDGFFLRMALSPGVGDVSSPFTVREVTPEQLAPQILDGVDAVILANVGTVPQAAEEALRQFMEGGGGVLLLCGNKAEPEQFNQSLADLAPCKLWRTALGDEQSPSSAVISVVDLKHEIFAPFAGPHTGDFATPEFAQYYLVKPLQAASVLARFNTGHPALLEMPFGKGKSILFVSAMDLEWNNLCLKSIFVPFVHQLTKRLCAEQVAGPRNAVVGERVVHRLSEDVDKVRVQLLGAPQSEPEARIGGVGDTKSIAFSPDRPGIYEVAYGNHRARFAVNLDPREPDLRRLDTRELISSVQPSPLLSVKDKVGIPTFVGKATARERAEAQQGLWVYVIALVLVVLAVEMILAARSGTA